MNQLDQDISEFEEWQQSSDLDLTSTDQYPYIPLALELSKTHRILPRRSETSA